MNIDPRGLTLTDWADSMGLITGSIAQVERLDDESQWQDWATNLIDTPTFEGQNAPNPFQFDDWVEWAMRFNQVVDLPG